MEFLGLKDGKVTIPSALPLSMADRLAFSTEQSSTAKQDLLLIFFYFSHFAYPLAPRRCATCRWHAGRRTVRGKGLARACAREGFVFLGGEDESQKRSPLFYGGKGIKTRRLTAACRGCLVATGHESTS